MYSLDQSIQHYLASWDITQAQFAEHFGVDERSVRRWKSGKTTPRTKNRQKLNPFLSTMEDLMNRRDFFRNAFAIGIMFAAPYQPANIQILTELLAPSSTPLSIKEELPLLEMLTKTCWQLLPHQANVIDRPYLDYVRSCRQWIESRLHSSPGSPFDLYLAGAISEMKQVEGGLLYALKYPVEAEKSYRDAISDAIKAKNPSLEAIGLTWLSNFLIDTGQAVKAVAPIDAAKSKARQSEAPTLVQAWIIATEADAWANQVVPYKSEKALDKAAQLTISAGDEQERYQVPYDYPWLFGYRGAVYAHLGHACKARHEMEQGLASLRPSETFRQWGFYNDLILAHSLDNNIEEICRYARLAMMRAEQSNTPIYLERTQNTARQTLKSEKESPIVKSLMEEFRIAQQKLALAR